MACLAVLKSEIKELERTFPASHERLQIVSASVDELTCRFVDHQGKKHVIHANITVSDHGANYPSISRFPSQFQTSYFKSFLLATFPFTKLL